jgi:putative oxidoreductase
VHDRRRFRWVIVNVGNGVDGRILLTLRLLMGALFVTHGYQKVLAGVHDPSMAGFARAVQAIGFFPGVYWAWTVTLVEFLGGICLCLGLATRLAAGLIVIEMVVAGLKVNLPRGFYWNMGGVEVPLIFAVLGSILVLAGPGSLSADHLIRDRHRRPP